MGRVLGLAFSAVVAVLVGCGGGDDFQPSGDRFSPGSDDEIVAKQVKKGDDCEAGVCAPSAPAENTPAPSSDPTKPKPADGDACKAQGSCSAANDLGSVAGDTGGDTRSTQGHSSEWFSIDVTENDRGVTAARMKLAVTLVSPKSGNYDLFLYDGDCGTAVKTSTAAAGSTDKITYEWGEGGGYNPFSNNSDDKKTLVIEVRHVSSEVCDADHEWTLLVQGNTL